MHSSCPLCTQNLTCFGSTLDLKCHGGFEPWLSDIKWINMIFIFRGLFPLKLEVWLNYSWFIHIYSTSSSLIFSSHPYIYYNLLQLIYLTSSKKWFLKISPIFAHAFWVVLLLWIFLSFWPGYQTTYMRALIACRSWSTRRPGAIFLINSRSLLYK